MYPTLKVPVLPHITLPLVLSPFPYQLIAVGDIHGCLHELISLLHVCDFPVPSSLVSIPEDFKVELMNPNDENKQLYEYKFSTNEVDASWLLEKDLNIETRGTPLLASEVGNLGKRKIGMDTVFGSNSVSNTPEQMTTVLVILGDLVNKGPFSAEVVHFLHSLELYCEEENKKNDSRKYFVYYLRGNHDEAAIRWATEPNQAIIPDKYNYVTRWSK